MVSENGKNENLKLIFEKNKHWNVDNERCKSCIYTKISILNISKIIFAEFYLNNGEPSSKFKNKLWPIVNKYCEGKVKKVEKFWNYLFISNCSESNNVPFV